MRTTRYFEEQVLVKRTYLSKEMCERIVAEPEHSEVQEDGRTRHWGFVEALGKHIRVVVLEDGETIHNAFMDRNYKS